MEGDKIRRDNRNNTWLLLTLPVCFANSHLVFTHVSLVFQHIPRVFAYPHLHLLAG